MADKIQILTEAVASADKLLELKEQQLKFCYQFKLSLLSELHDHQPTFWLAKLKVPELVKLFDEYNAMRVKAGLDLIGGLGENHTRVLKVELARSWQGMELAKWLHAKKTREQNQERPVND